MAKFNECSISKEFLNDEKTMEECGIYLQSLLSDKELERLKEDWQSKGGFKVIPYWKFAFENINVSYGNGESE